MDKLKSDSSGIFLGEVPDMNQTIMQADMAVCPMNLASGMQNKVIEAMAAGVIDEFFNYTFGIFIKGCFCVLGWAMN